MAVAVALAEALRDAACEALTLELPLVEAATRKVHELLTAPHFVAAEPRPFEPHEICVLVRTNRTGSVLAKRLVDLGIPAVTEGTASVMAGQMALDIRGLLEAMERPSTAGRTRRGSRRSKSPASVSRSRIGG
jgi:ATP-dependent exoDNAse (exonuclease V) beta subunit